MPKRLATFALACTLASAAQAAVPVYGFVVKNSYPHDQKAFTQGLFFRDGHLFETTGRAGSSSLRKVDLGSGKVVQKADLPADVFGEGSTPVGGDIVALTWTSQVGYVFDMKTFKLKHTFKYAGEGWGLASDARQVYMSDGSAFIRILAPGSYTELRRIQVTHEGRPIGQLNELEMVDGELFANVWGRDLIVRIDPADLDAVLRQRDRPGRLAAPVAARHRRPGRGPERHRLGQQAPAPVRHRQAVAEGVRDRAGAAEEVISRARPSWPAILAGHPSRPRRSPPCRSANPIPCSGKLPAPG